MQVTARTHDLKNSYHLYFKHSTIYAIALKFKQHKSLHVHIQYICKCILSDINAALQLCMHKVNFVPAHQILFMNLSNKLYLGFFGVLWTQDLQSFTVNLLLRVVIVTEHGVALNSCLVD